MGLLDFLSFNLSLNNSESKQSRNSEEFTPLFFNNPDAIFTLNEERQVISVNKKFTELFGYSFKEVKKWQDAQYNSFNKIQSHLYGALQGIPSSFEMVIEHKKGGEIPVNITLIPSLGENKSVIIFGICKDLTPIKKYENKIKTLDDYLEQAQEETDIGTWDYDFKENITFFSNQTYKIFGIKDPERFDISFKHLKTFFSEEDRKTWEQSLFQAINAKRGFTLEHQITRENGEKRKVVQQADVLLDEAGNVIRLKGTILDITEKRALQDKLLENETQFQSVADRLAVGIWSYDINKNQITFCSHGVESIYGFTADELKENPMLWQEFVHPEDQAAVEANQERLWSGKELIHQYRIIDKKGKVKWLTDQTIPYLDKEGKVIRIDSIVKDITDEKNYTEELAFLTEHDHLTKLPNRRYFEKKLNELIEESKKAEKRFAVFYLDLDRFNYINDTLGHELGDQLLVAITNRLNPVLGQNTVLARMGGDEFAIFLKDIEKIEDALNVANKVIEELEIPFYLDDYELYVTTSIGISFFPADGEDSLTLLKNADNALYKVKESGRNDWQIYSSSMNVASFKLYQLEKDLRKALSKNEFFLEYQPKVNTKTGKIEGAEALIRWKHPEWGIVSPAEFIPLAEENGYIFKMGDWVLKEVCKLLQKWKKEGVPVVPISVNVSPKRVLKKDFVSSIQEVIDTTGIDPGLIELELTENVILRSTETAKKVISELKDYGVKFSLDDFGTGYSSLSYLKDLDIDTLKIDKSFIDGIGLSKANEGIIKSVIFLSKALDIRIVAEGVEKHGQLDFLLQQECDQIQGYVFSRPVKGFEFKKLLQKAFIKPVQVKRKEFFVENRRNFYRLKFDYSLCADMTIVKFKDKDVKLGRSRALIENISLGGMKYLSNINLPVQKDVVLQFIATIFNEEIHFTGKNIWKLEHEGVYQYGFEFDFNEAQRSEFAPILNKLMVQLRRNPLLPGCDFLQENKISYLKG